MAVTALLRAALGKQFSIAADAMLGLSGGAMAIARRQIIGQFVPGLIRAGFSGRGALSLFREAGLGVGTGAFYSLFRGGQDQIRTQSYVGGASGEDMIDLSQARITDWAYTDAYTAKVKIFYRDTETGRYASRYVNVGVMEGDTKADVEQRAFDKIQVDWQRGKSQYIAEVFSMDMEDLLETA